MIKSIITGALALTTLGTGATALVVSPIQTSSNSISFKSGFDTSIIYSVEEMLTLAIEDEYLAKTTYVKLLEVFPEHQMLTRLAAAEQRHIDLLLPLFDKYEVLVPVDTTDNLVISFATIEEAAIYISENETYNITMYQHFLSQSDLPDDLKDVFGKLLSGSMMHLQASQRVATSTLNRKSPINGLLNRKSKTMSRHQRQLKINRNIE